MPGWHPYSGVANISQYGFRRLATNTLFVSADFEDEYVTSLLSCLIKVQFCDSYKHYLFISRGGPLKKYDYILSRCSVVLLALKESSIDFEYFLFLGSHLPSLEVQHKLCHQDRSGTSQPLWAAQNVGWTAENQQKLSSCYHQGLYVDQPLLFWIYRIYD